MTVRAALLPGLFLFIFWIVPCIAQGDRPPGTYDQDIESLRMQLQSDPDNTELKYQLARHYNFNGQYRQAIELFEELLDVNANNADYLLGIGQSYLWSKQAATSIDYLEKAARLTPDYEAVQRALATAYRASGQEEKANAVYRDALSSFDQPDWALTGVQSGTGKDYPQFGLRMHNHMESLGYNPDSWRETRLALTTFLDENRNLTLFAEDAEHFSLDDQTYGISAAFPLFDRTWSYAEISFSPTHHFSPGYSLYAQVGHGFPHGWGILAGIRHRDYSNSTVNILDGTVEKYIGNYRLAYTLFASDSNVAGSAYSHRLQAGYYFAEKNSMQFAVTSGEEVDKITGANQIIRTEFTDVSLWGEFWVTTDFALEYGIGYTDLNLPVQGDSHRKHISLGIDYRF
ncbi:MAG TPA: tetratricopeptide repeat protein [Gammaproteobacteria bacterium]|nr:tetratricopeptide repeat protein [Gammaproteobacteria bacterium]